MFKENKKKGKEKYLHFLRHTFLFCVWTHTFISSENFQSQNYRVTFPSGRERGKEGKLFKITCMQSEQFLIHKIDIA